MHAKHTQKTNRSEISIVCSNLNLEICCDYFVCVCVSIVIYNGKKKNQLEMLNFLIYGANNENQLWTNVFSRSKAGKVFSTAGNHEIWSCNGEICVPTRYFTAIHYLVITNKYFIWISISLGIKTEWSNYVADIFIAFQLRLKYETFKFQITLTCHHYTPAHMHYCTYQILEIK